MVFMVSKATAQVETPLLGLRCVLNGQELMRMDASNAPYGPCHGATITHPGCCIDQSPRLEGGPDDRSV